MTDRKPGTYQELACSLLAPQKREWPWAHLSSYARAIVHQLTAAVNTAPANRAVLIEGHSRGRGINHLVGLGLATPPRDPDLVPLAPPSK